MSALIPGPAHTLRGLPRFMIFVFLDEFGHNGPWVARNDPKYNTSPVFGLAGYLLHESKVRNFGTFYLKLKEKYLQHDPTRQGRPYHEWEKKGTNLFTERSITKYPTIKESMFRLITELQRRDGRLLYVGREKLIGNGPELNPNGLYTTVFSDVIRRLNKYCEAKNENFAIVLDEHSARKELLVTAAKTMFGNDPARRMMCPPFEVESHLNQNIQAADWIATIVGRIWNHKVDPVGFEGLEHYKTYFEQRIENVATHSSVLRRRPKKSTESVSALGGLGEKLIAAGLVGSTAS